MASKKPRKKKSHPQRRTSYAIATAKQNVAAPQDAMLEVSFTTSTRLFAKGITPYNPDDLVRKKGLTIYKQMMSDNQVKAGVAVKQNAVLSTGFEIMAPEVEEDSDDEEIAKEQQQFIDFNFAEMEGAFDAKLIEVMSALWAGFSVSEKVFYLIDYGRWNGKIGLKALKTREPFSFDFDQDAHGNLAENGVWQDKGQLKMPRDKFVIYTYRRQFDNLYGESDLRAAHRPWWNKDNTLRFMMIAIERYGEPIAVFTAAGKVSSAQETQIKAFSQNLQNRSSIVLPNGLTVDFKSPDPKAANVFIPALQHHDTEIRIALLMPGLIGLSGEQAVGSFARAVQEFDVFILIVEQIRKELETLTNEQIVKPLIDLNYEVLEGKYPTFRFKKMTEEHKQKIFDNWLKALQAGALNKKFEDENQMREYLGLAPLSEDEWNAIQQEKQDQLNLRFGGANGAASDSEDDDDTGRFNFFPHGKISYLSFRASA